MADASAAALLLAGLVALAAVAVDVLRTVLDVTHGHGPITGPIGRRVWLRLVAWHHRGMAANVLSVAGLLLTISVVGAWLTGLVAGWSLIYLAADSALVSGATGASVGVLDRIYFAAGGLFSLSLGDVLPGSSPWRLVAAANVGSGLLILTLSITYAVPVIEAATRRRVFASTVATLGDDASAIVANHLRAIGSSPFIDELADLRRTIIELAHLHLAYPVLHYFHSADRRAAFGPNLAALYDAIVALEFGCSSLSDHRTMLTHTRTAIETFLDPLILAPNGQHQPPPLPTVTCRRPTACTRAAPTMTDVELELTAHRRKLAALVHEEGWSMPDPPRPAVRAPTVRPVEEHDLAAVLALNQAHVPAVGSLELCDLARLVELAETAALAEDGDELLGFVIALPPGVDYASPNYGWFDARHDDFVYVDRIAVAADQQRTGVGHLLYDEVESRTQAGVFCCEVNIRPRNEVSLRFHEVRGFRHVGQQDTGAGAKRVVLLEKELR